jgi:hypothetical protein
VTPHAKQDLLSEVRKEAHHVAETLKHTQTVGKQDLLSEVRRESLHVAEGLKKAATSSKRDLMGEIRKSATKADIAADALTAAAAAVPDE